MLCAGTALAVGAPSAQAAGPASVSIQGTQFLIDGSPSYPGRPIQGLLLNSRMIQAVWDDENPATVANWAYPDTGRWDPQRNTDEFIAALPSYAAAGLRSVTVGFQGGDPGWANLAGGHGVNDQPNVSTGFNPDGTLKPAWLSRLDRVLTAAADNGIVVVVSYFYFGQDQRLSSDAAVQAGVDNLTDWLLGVGNPYRSSPYPNVLVEVANEADNVYDRPSLQAANIPLLVDRVRQRSGGRLRVGNSLNGGSIPSDALIRASDFVLLHGNLQSPASITDIVNQVRGKSSYGADPKPIVFNEDSTSIANLDAATAAGASWGYYDQGLNDYVEGFQSAPVNWGINTVAKQSFFGLVSRLAGIGTTTARRLLVSTAPDRSGAVPLAGTVSGTVYAFLGPPDGASSVRFYLDDPSRAGPPRQTEYFAPFDFAGGSSTLANPFDTSQLDDGLHTITAAVAQVGGGEQVVSASFTALNHPVAIPQPDFDLWITPSAAVTHGNSATFTVNVTALDGYARTVALTVTGLPAGAVGTFAPQSLVAPGSSVLTVRTIGRTPSGTFRLTVTGSDGTRSRSVGADLVVP